MIRVAPPSDGDPVPTESSLLRLPKPPPDFSPDGWRPPGTLFQPSTTEKRLAETQQKPVRVSVWDEGRTTVEQALSFRPGSVLVLRLPVVDLLAVGQRWERPIRVVYDPLEPPESDRPGVDGHAGIEGLERASLPRPRWCKILDDVAGCCQFAT